MSSFYDRWATLARHCAEQRVEPALACEMQERRLSQAEAYYTWVSKRRDARVITSPDPMLYPDDIPLLRTDWLYGDALEDIIGPLPRDEGLYGWAQAALAKIRQMSADEMCGKRARWSDWVPWGLFTEMILGNLHSFAHFVGHNTPYSDNPYKFERRIPSWVDAEAWAKEHGLL
jgi:hypothetical protein